VEVFPDKILATLINLINYQNKENATLNNGKNTKITLDYVKSRM